MKEVRIDFEGIPYQRTVPTCDTCRFKGTRLEMVAPNCSATVDFCKKGYALALPQRCDIYVKNFKTRVKDALETL